MWLQIAGSLLHLGNPRDYARVNLTCFAHSVNKIAAAKYGRDDVLEILKIGKKSSS